MKHDILNRNDIVTLINNFYTKVKQDQSIGYFFTDVAAIDWDHHLPQMYDFWESLLFSKSLFSGNPMKKHIELNNKSPLTEKHFEQWIKLFNLAVDSSFEGVNSNRIKNYALTIQENLISRILKPNVIINEV